MDLGWEQYQQKLNPETAISGENVARVAVENRGSYLLYSELGELEGILRGKFMRDAKNDSDYPKVGDWVVFEKLQGENKAIITTILPRASKISRKKAGENSEEQIIATNIEIVFIIQGLDGDFNLGRLARYVAMTNEGNCQPVILLNKCDLTPDAPAKLAEVQQALPGITIFLTSATTGFGVEDVRPLIESGISVVFVGSSGTGKSTLINNLLGIDRQSTGEIRIDDSKGKHTTTRRELILLESGGVLIDTPGMRELGMWTEEETTPEVFADIDALIGNCKFNDCDHQTNPGCAVANAVARGEISKDNYQSFLKIKNNTDSRHKRGRK